MNTILVTQRTYLREFLDQDIHELLKLNSNPEVVRFTPEKVYKDLGDAQTFLKNHFYLSPHRLGRWAIVRKADEEFLGWCGLKFFPEDGVVDLGYRLKKEFWRMGYASEVAKACVAYAFNDVKLYKLVAHSHVDNHPSIRVLEKLGFIFRKSLIHQGMPIHQFELQNSHYNLQQISAKETYPVRHPVLRKGRPITDCEFENDNAATTVHIGLFFKKDLVGVATYLAHENPNFNGSQYQLRGMAVLEEYKHRGLGSIIFKEGERLLKELKVAMLWFNARVIALGFYRKQGCKTYGEPFEIKGVGTHYLMHKKLT